MTPILHSNCTLTRGLFLIVYDFTYSLMERLAASHFISLVSTGMVAEAKRVLVSLKNLLNYR